MAKHKKRQWSRVKSITPTVNGRVRVPRPHGGRREPKQTNRQEAA